MKTQTEIRTTNQIRTARIAKKLDSVNSALEIATDGLRSANKKNPFWSKSDAMKELNRLRKIKNQLANIWCLEFSL